MSIGAIIAALISVLGPMFVEWLRKWIESRLHKAAEKLPPVESFASEHEARDALFDAALKDLPKYAKGRRALLKRMKSAASAAGITSAGAANPLPDTEVAALAALAEDAGKE